MNSDSKSAGPELCSSSGAPVPLRTLDEPLLKVAERIPKERYIGRDFAQQEAAKLWPKVWQMACRERDLPNKGDYYEYQISHESILIVRDMENQVRAFYNACQHRGNKLLSGRGKCGSAILCAYHWWSYGLDGRLQNIPNRANLEVPISDDEYGLKPILCDLWGGYVWINMDLDAEPLLDYLHPIPEQTSMYNLDEWYCTVNHVEVISANWKTPVDNFLEIYHIPALHPQIKKGFGWAPDHGPQGKTEINEMLDDGRSPIDLYRLHSRQVNPQGVNGGDAGRPEASNQQRLAELLAVRFGFVREDERGSVELEDGQSARQWLIQKMRSHYELQGFDLSRYNDSQVVDRIRYHIFPNVCLTVTPSSMLVWRARPAGSDPDKCIMQIMEFSPIPEGMANSVQEAEVELFPSGKERGPQRLGVDLKKGGDGTQVYHQRIARTDSYAEVPPIQHSFADTVVEEQDYGVLGTQQSGMHSRGFQGLRLMQQERRIRKYHEVIDEFLWSDK